MLNYSHFSKLVIAFLAVNLLKSVSHGESPCAVGHNDRCLVALSYRQAADSVWSLQNSSGGTRHHAADRYQVRYRSLIVGTFLYAKKARVGVRAVRNKTKREENYSAIR